MGEYIQLSAGTKILTRDANTIQFGLDASIAGVFHTVIGDTAAIIAALHKTPLQVDQLTKDFLAAGLPEVETAGLIADLFTHGIIEIRQTQPLQLIGSGPIYEALHELCAAPAALEFAVSSLQPGESIMQFLARGNPTVPLIMVTEKALRPEYAAGLRHYETVLPISHIDGQGLIGPMRVRGQGPCLMCAFLYRCQNDATWRQHLRAADETQLLDKASAYATAAQAFAHLQGLFQHHIAPGVALYPPRAGQQLRVTAQQIHEDFIQPYPLCPECNNEN